MPYELLQITERLSITAQKQRHRNIFKIKTGKSRRDIEPGRLLCRLALFSPSRGISIRLRGEEKSILHRSRQPFLTAQKQRHRSLYSTTKTPGCGKIRSRGFTDIRESEVVLLTGKEQNHPFCTIILQLNGTKIKRSVAFLIFLNRFVAFLHCSRLAAYY